MSKELVERLNYILGADGKESMHRRSHLTGHDLRQCKAALEALTPTGEAGEIVEALRSEGDYREAADHNLMQDAAALIISLQAQLAAREAELAGFAEAANTYLDQGSDPCHESCAALEEYITRMKGTDNER
jgi:hypothetical protein